MYAFPLPFFGQKAALLQPAASLVTPSSELPYLTHHSVAFVFDGGDEGLKGNTSWFDHLLRHTYKVCRQEIDVLYVATHYNTNTPASNTMAYNAR